MNVLENELQGEIINRIESVFMLRKILVYPSADTQQSVRTGIHGYQSDPTGKHSGMSVLGHKITRVSALGHTAERPY
jgi:hypothetical protein